jgi:hypothetical protein
MERGAFNNLLIAHAQIWGLLITLVSLVAFIVIILLGYAKLDPTTEKLAYTILGVFLAKFGDMVAYLYNRQRPETSGVVVTPEKPSDPKDQSVPQQPKVN